MKQQHFVIIGNGIAGMSAANELRRRNEDIDITIISRESDHFFSRTALMYEFCGQMGRRDLEPFERDHYERMSFGRISGEVTSIDVERQQLILADSSAVQYDRLLIACGSVPAKPDWQDDTLSGLGNFVTLQDLEWLKRVARSGQNLRAGIVGGGLIGVEVAEILALEGIETHFIIREEWYWPVALDKNESKFVASHIRDHGVAVHLGDEVSALIHDGSKLQGVQLKSGNSLDLDFLVVAIGVRPATAWLEDTQISLSQDRFEGIEVDQFLQTNVENVFAAGDCANVEWFNQVRRPEQLWYTGRDQGVIVARNMLGDQQEYKRGTFYNSAKFFDIEYTTAGLVNFPLEGISEWYQEDIQKCRSQRIVVQDDRVIGFNMLGSRWNHEIFIEWIEQRRSLDWVLRNLPSAVFDAEFSDRFVVHS